LLLGSSERMKTIKRTIATVHLVLFLICGLSSLTGCGQSEEPAQVVWLYDYQGAPRVAFQNVTVYEKRTGYIKFRVGDQLIQLSHA